MTHPILIFNPLLSAKILTNKVAVGDQVLVRENTLISCHQKPSHQVTTIHPDNKVSVIDLKTLELQLIEL